MADPKAAPVPRLNAATRKAFLIHLSETANVSASARKVDVGTSSIYAERRRLSDFRAAWTAALAEGYGQLRFLDGANCGLVSDVAISSFNQIILVRPPAFTVLPNARVELIQGCDKTMATCSDRFANAINFRGEPYLPGNDLLTRYPGAG
jgi:uncharacterized phage protein (TIGR02218 family)